MASPSKRSKFDYSDSAVGFVHCVSELKTSFVKKSKYFNAILQVDRDEFHDLVAFSPDKRISFVQAQNAKTPVKLTNVSKPLGRAGEGYDVMCGRNTEVLVVDTVNFTTKDPPGQSQKTVAEILQMGAKQPVGSIVGRIVLVSAATESVPYYGNVSETQTTYVEDETGKIKLQLWGSNIGALECGETYKLSNLATREFRGNVYITTTKNTQLQQVEPSEALKAIQPSTTEQQTIDALLGTVKRIQVTVSRRCGHCKAWQQNFKEKSKNYRCERCNLLQRAATYEPTASGTFCIVAGPEERTLNVSNSVLKRYLETEQLLQLFQDSEDLEEHFLETNLYIFQIQEEIVVSITKVIEVNDSSDTVVEVQST